MVLSFLNSLSDSFELSSLTAVLIPVDCKCKLYTRTVSDLIFISENIERLAEFGKLITPVFINLNFEKITSSDFEFD
nr:hypothetical protein [uncultured bacterium]